MRIKAHIVAVVRLQSATHLRQVESLTPTRTTDASQHAAAAVNKNSHRKHKLCASAL